MIHIETQQEQLRQEYLAALGVTLWLPRQALPGAAVSPAWHWHAAKPSGSADAALNPATGTSSTPVNRSLVNSASAAQENHRPLPHAMPLRQLLKEPLKQPSSPPAMTGLESAVTDSAAESQFSIAVGTEQQKILAASLDPEVEASTQVTAEASVLETAVSKTVASKAATSKTAALEAADSGIAGSEMPASTRVPKFRLAMLGYSDCLVVTELPNGQSLGWSAEHQLLLDAILNAINLGGQVQSSSGVSEFQWPLDPLARFDQSASIARHALKVTLENALKTEHRVLLLMGRSAHEYLFAPGKKLSLGELMDFQGRSTLCCHGLNEVLRLPKLKAELWRQLQPLRNSSGGH
tara:strand:- start:12562 stop:13614 length:1053 start_codon:yes stop_codon:yes gene_type:complete